MKVMGRIILVVALLGLLAGASWFAIEVWNSIEGPPMPPFGYAMMALGVGFSLLIGCGLMALVFYSSRYGYDDAPQGPEHDRQ